MTYNEFIQNIINTRGQWNIPDGEYWEGHHILPKCMGGEGQSYQKHPNIIRLYAREHFIAHRLLAEENPDNKGLQLAFYCMVFMKSDIHEVTPEEYEAARILYANSITGEGNPMYGRSLYDDKDEKELEEIYTKQSKARLKYYEEHPDFNKGKNNGMYHYQYTEEQKNRMFMGENNPFYGKTHTDEHKEKMRKGAHDCVWYTNGYININCKPENVPEGFYKGKIGYQLYTNGIKEIQIKPHDEIPPGYYKGSIKRIYYTNGKDNIRLRVNDLIPDGFYRGRTGNGRRNKNDK